MRFYSGLAHNLERGINCIHYHRLKQEELCILLRGYYSSEDLYSLLGPIVGTSDNFKDLVLRNYRTIHDIKAFASIANMSVRNFQRRFKAEFNLSAREWLNERRAELILRDIRSSDKKIVEIAVNYGFATPSHFTVFCKQHYGMTPSQLRKMKG